MQNDLSNTIAAVFATQHDAGAAVKELHKAGFKKTWLGITRPGPGFDGEPRVEEPGSLARFFSPDDTPLHRALLQHGVSESQAQQVERDIAPGCAVVTVYAEDNPQRVSEILSISRGQVVGGDQEPSAVDIASREPRTGVDKDERKAVDQERKEQTRATKDQTRASSVSGDVRETTSYDEVEYEEFVMRRPTGGVR